MRHIDDYETAILKSTSLTSPHPHRPSSRAGPVADVGLPCAGDAADCSYCFGHGLIEMDDDTVAAGFGYSAVAESHRLALASLLGILATNLQSTKIMLLTVWWLLCVYRRAVLDRVRIHMSLGSLVRALLHHHGSPPSRAWKSARRL